MCDWVTRELRKNIQSWVVTGDNCCRSRVPKISLPYSILVRVCVKMIKGSVQQVLALHRGCVYPKSRICSDTAYTISRYSLRFAPIWNLILVLMSNMFLFGRSLTVTLGWSSPNLSQGRCLPQGCQPWNCDWVFVWCPRTLTMMLKEKRGPILNLSIFLLA